MVYIPIEASTCYPSRLIQELCLKLLFDTQQLYSYGYVDLQSVKLRNTAPPHSHIQPRDAEAMYQDID